MSDFANHLPVVVYSKPGCVQCDATERWLKQHKVPYRKVDVTEDEAALEMVKNMGYQQVPVVVVPFDYPTAAGHHWSGFQPDKLKAILA